VLSSLRRPAISLPVMLFSFTTIGPLKAPALTRMP
jgi:hypothetical protein